MHLIFLVLLHHSVALSCASSSKTASESNHVQDVVFNHNSAVTEDFTTELLYRLDWVPCVNATPPAPGYVLISYNNK